MRKWAAIFDWDGVVIDSSAQHSTAWNRLAERTGRAVPKGFFERSFGMKNERVIPDLLDWSHDRDEIARLSIEKEAIYRDMIRDDGIGILPGVAELLEALTNNGIPAAVGSSTLRENIECVIDQLGVRDAFAAIITGEDVHEGKPHPEVFQKAADALGMPHSSCVVFEDAHVGIEAAKRAGMRVVAVATTHPADTLQTADLVVERLTEITVEGVFALHTTNG